MEITQITKTILNNRGITGESEIEELAEEQDALE